MNIAQPLKGIAGASWSPWSFEDRSLYEARFAKVDESGSYETNFAFVQQECRRSAWKFVSNDLLVTAYSGGPDSEFVFLLPPVGRAERAIEQLPGLCRDISLATGRRVVLRKQSAALAEALGGDSRFRPVPLETYRNPRELPEDIHPQVVAPTRLAGDFNGSGFVKLRNSLRNAQRTHDIAFCNLSASRRDSARSAIEAWARDHDLRVRQSSSAGKAPADGQGIDASAYTIFCDRMAALVDDRLYFGRIMLLDGVPSALAFAGRTASDTAALYVSICRSRTRGASDCMIADMLEHLKRHEIELMNFGGSEGADLFWFKDKWGSCRHIRTHELEFLGK